MDGSDGTPQQRTPLLGVALGRLPLAQRAAYGVGHVCNDVCAAMWFSYTLLFLQDVIGLAPVAAGAMLLLGQVVDALATPVIGVLTDRKGSRKIWHLFGSGLVLLSFPLIFTECPGCHEMSVWATIMYYSVMITVFQTGWAIVQISHLALIPDLAPTQEGRAELTAIRYMASVLSSVTVYVVTWIVLHTSDDDESNIGPKDAYKFRDIVLTVTGVGLLSSLWFQFGLKPINSPPSETQSVNETTETGLSGSVRSFLRSPLLFQVALLYVASRLFLTISLVYMPLYLNEKIVIREEIIATVPLVSYIASLVASLSIKYANKAWGTKISYLLGAVISVSGCVWVAYGNESDFLDNSIYGVAVLLGAGSSMTMVTSLCITADFIGANTHNGAFVYSIVTFADKLLNGIAVMLIEELRCPSLPLCPHYYQNVMAYVCGASAVAGFIVLSTMMDTPKPLDKICCCKKKKTTVSQNGVIQSQCNGTHVLS